VRANPWILSTFVLGILTFAFLITYSGGMTGNVISEEDAGEVILGFVQSQTQGQGELVEVKEFNNYFYEAIVLFQGNEFSLFITKDGKYFTSNLMSFEDMQQPSQETPQEQEPAKPILGCAESYGITGDTVIFYYSNSCGWCTKMKPGVEALEKEGYNFEWIEAGGAGSELIDDCVQAHMTSGGIPQFICPKTDEIHVGAFTNADGELDQSALKAWVDNCISD
jgi:hypothetical protein